MNHRGIALAGAAILAAALAGCSSDLPSEVGSDLATIAVDSVLVPLELTVPTSYSALAIEDDDVLLSRHQVLYLGGQNGTRSSILVNFDFGDVFNEDFPESLFTEENIQTVKLGLMKLTFYTQPADTLTAVPALYYHVYMLDAPFDSTAYPGPVPAHDARDLNQDYLGEQGSEPLIRLATADFLAWVAAGDTVGFLIEAGSESDSALVGFAARDLVRIDQIPDVAVGTIPAPNLVVDLVSEDVNHLIAPVADISTFHHVAEAPADIADGMLVRTCQRSYPALTFDLDLLPEGAYINRAVLVLHNDTSRGMGTLQTLVVSELDEALFGDPFTTLTLGELEAAVHTVTGALSNDPDYNERFDFNVTASVQRAVNGAYEGRRGFLISGDESVFTSYSTSTIKPDFYFNEFHFFGTAAPDSLRPRLQISYSVVDTLGEGGDE